MERTDEELITEYHNGDQTALEVLFGRWKKPVFNFALRILGNRADAEDVTGEVMLVLFSKKEAYINTVEVKFSTWLFTVTRNSCLNQIRKRKKTVSLWFTSKREGEYEAWDIPDARRLPPEEMARQETALKIRQLIYGLPLNQKEALVLREYHAMSYQEISAVLGCSVDNIKVLIFRARERLRVLLSAEITEERNG